LPGFDARLRRPTVFVRRSNITTVATGGGLFFCDAVGIPTYGLSLPRDIVLTDASGTPRDHRRTQRQDPVALGGSDITAPAGDRDADHHRT
jgi:hypothetical protein